MAAYCSILLNFEQITRSRCAENVYWATLRFFVLDLSKWWEDLRNMQF